MVVHIVLVKKNLYFSRLICQRARHLYGPSSFVNTIRSLSVCQLTPLQYIGHLSAQTQGRKIHLALKIRTVFCRRTKQVLYSDCATSSACYIDKRIFCNPNEIQSKKNNLNSVKKRNLVTTIFFIYVFPQFM